MTSLADLKPTSKPLLITLTEEAGIDVSDWAKGGPSNPKYCYEWCYTQGDTIVLCLWLEEMTQDRADAPIRTFRGPIRLNLGPTRARRAAKFQEALELARARALPIRAIISEGKMKDFDVPDTPSSSVERRMLDPVSWWVTNYDPATSQYTLTRGRRPMALVDQFDLQVQNEQRVVEQLVHSRSADVRRHALERSDGKCEWCGQPGFAMDNGRLFLETHHVVPLSENGADSAVNVVALCPNHHREAHHGMERQAMREQLLKKLRGL
jgi:hypothetical protein